MGIGPGNVVEVVVKRFGTVVASDPSTDHIAFAKERAAALGSLGNFFFEQARAEDLAYLNGVNTSSFRTSDRCGSIHLRPHKYLEAWENTGYMVLWPIHLCRRRNGTVLTVIYDNLLAVAYDKVRPLKDMSFERAWKELIARLDVVGFPAKELEKAKRMEGNNDRAFGFLLVEKTDYHEIDRSSELTGQEQVEQETDSTFWIQDSNIPWIRGHVKMVY